MEIGGGRGMGRVVRMIMRERKGEKKDTCYMCDGGKNNFYLFSR